MSKKLNNIVFFASNEGGHFAQLMASHECSTSMRPSL